MQLRYLPTGLSRQVGLKSEMALTLFNVAHNVSWSIHLSPRSQRPSLLLHFEHFILWVLSFSKEVSQIHFRQIINILRFQMQSKF